MIPTAHHVSLVELKRGHSSSPHPFGKVLSETDSETIYMQGICYGSAAGETMGSRMGMRRKPHKGVISGEIPEGLRNVHHTPARPTSNQGSWVSVPPPSMTQPSAMGEGSLQTPKAL